jgi:dTDP-4-amino-4,6-dideoxygalactose transaminase
MKVPLVDLKAQYQSIKPEIDAAMQRVIENTSFIMGKEVANFEQAFAEYIGAKGAVGVASGTTAIQLALLACGIGSGDEVITTAHTFIATGEMISATGAKPIFVDIDPQSYNLDPNLVEAAITGRTKAIVPVHLYGQSADMDPLLEIASRHNLRIVEDAAQAHGAEYKGRRCGTLGDLATFSFFPAKNLGGFGDGGGVTGNNEELLHTVSILRNHGRTKKYEHEELGFGERLDALQAAILGAKLPHLEAWTEARRAHACRYEELLADCEQVTAPPVGPEMRHVYTYYVIRAQRRDELLNHLNAQGVGAGIHYPLPLHQQPAYLKLGYGDVSLPVTERVAAEIVSLPMFAELTDEQLVYVTDTIKEFYNDR